MRKLLSFIFFTIICIFVSAQVSKTINVSTAGTLSTLLTSTEKSTVTNLTVTGTIDARDFVTMRDSIPTLAVLDISSVYIAAYEGSNGTSSWDNIYPLNTLPPYSFCNLTFEGKTTLTTILLPNSVTSIGNSAFQGCNALTSVTIPNLVTTIGEKAFYECSGLTSVTIPNSITSIENSAFFLCRGLTSVTIPNSVTSIENWAFAYCLGLTSLNVPNSVTSIGEYAFGYCSGLFTVDANNPYYSSKNGVLFDKNQTTVIQCPISIKGSYNIPNSVTSIGNSAFQYCSGLTLVTIPNSITSIGDFAFAKCSGLNTIYAYPTTQVDLNSSFNVFNGVNTTACTLYVPSGSLSAYQAANKWSAFTHIVEMIGTSVSTATVKPLYLYPNPVTDGFFIKGLNGNSALTLLNMKGKLLITKHIKDNDFISISSFPKGFYLVKITTHEGIFVQKVMKQ